MKPLCSALALILMAAVGGCGGGTSDAEGDPVLHIYVSAPLSGPGAADGQDVADGAKLALEDADAEAGGTAVEAEYLDSAGRNESRGDAVVAGENARTATEDSTTIAYIGELDSATSRTSIPLTNAAGILQVSPGAGASDLVVKETFDDSVPLEIQGTGARTFARVIPSDEIVADDLGKGLISAPADPADLPPSADDVLGRFEAEFGRKPGPWVAYGYEAMASTLAAIDRAGDPLDRQSVVDAYFDGTERDSALGPYVISEEGETSLMSPLAGEQP